MDKRKSESESENESEKNNIKIKNKVQAIEKRKWGEMEALEGEKEK